MKKSILLIGALLFLVIGYASVNTILNVNGILKIASSDFIVRISNTIMNNNDISEVAINDSKDEFKVTLNDTNIISYSIVNESDEYDALVYISCTSQRSPRTSIDWYLNDNYIKANGTSRGQAAIYFNNESYYEEIHQINLRIDELMIQYVNGTNTDFDKAAIMNEVNHLNVEKERLYNLIVDEDTLTCKMQVKSIEKTKKDDITVMDDVKFITAKEDEKDVSNYIVNDGKRIEFTKEENTDVFFEVKNTNSKYSASTFLRCSSTSSPQSTLYYGLNTSFAKSGETINGNIHLDLRQSEIKDELAAIDERIEELNEMLSRVETEYDRQSIQLELNALDEEKIRVEGLYLESDSVTCDLIVEHIEMIPSKEKEKAIIEFANIQKNGEDLEVNVISDDKKSIFFEANNQDRFTFEIHNKTPTYDTLVDFYCEALNNETMNIYYLTNNYIRARGVTYGINQVILNKNEIEYRIKYIDDEESFILDTLENYEISEEYRNYLTEQLVSMSSEREELYNRMIDKDNITCSATIVNFE